MSGRNIKTNGLHMADNSGMKESILVGYKKVVASLDNPADVHTSISTMVNNRDFEISLKWILKKSKVVFLLQGKKTH